VRWIRRSLLLLLVLIGTTSAVLVWGLQQIERQLTGQGFSWQERTLRSSSIAWHHLEATGVSAETLRMTFKPWPRLLLQNVNIDATNLDPETASSGTNPQAMPDWLPPIPFTIEAKEVFVAANGTQLVGPLSGVLHPDVTLSGETGHLHRRDGTWQLGFTKSIQWEHIAATMKVTITETRPLTIEMVSEAPRLTHPIISDETIILPRTTMKMQWDQHTHETVGSCQTGEITAQLNGTVDPLSKDFNLTLDSTADLQDVVDIFGQHIPEARHGRAVGTLHLSATTTGMPLEWQAQIGAENLSAEGIINNIEELKYGLFTWRAPTSDGEWTIRTTGEGHPDWTDRMEGRTVAAAMVAAEDATFFSHRGYDLEGMQIALDELAAGDPRARGGSTITQQLAKNLFLSGERTIVRKLRELLYTLEMERTLGKNRILTLYTNVVEMGPEIYGIRRGSEAYFLKQPAQLTIRESAFLSAILPSPRSSYTAAHQRNHRPVSAINTIIDNMVNTGHITHDQARFSIGRTLRFVPPADGRVH